MTLNDYADWSIPDLFDELISYCAGNIGDDTTEAIKAAITSKARSEGKAEGAEQALNMAQRWIDREWLASRHVVTLPHDILLEASVLALKRRGT